MPSQSLGALFACQFIESTTVDALETDLIARLEQAWLLAIGVKHPKRRSADYAPPARYLERVHHTLGVGYGDSAARHLDSGCGTSWHRQARRQTTQVRVARCETHHEDHELAALVPMNDLLDAQTGELAYSF
jgi:hypothetical protein